MCLCFYLIIIIYYHAKSVRSVDIPGVGAELQEAMSGFRPVRRSKSETSRRCFSQNKWIHNQSFKSLTSAQPIPIDSDQQPKTQNRKRKEEKSRSYQRT